MHASIATYGGIVTSLTASDRTLKPGESYRNVIVFRFSAR
jgi:galactose mutarotase-like enzyme